MNKIKFIQLSDTHFALEKADYMKELMKKIDNPVDILLKALNKIEFSKYDFVVVTGDLVNDSESKYYKQLDEILKEKINGTKLLYVLGNHDIKSEFYKGILDLNKGANEEYYYYKYINNYRIIILDTAPAGQHSGEINGKQEEWLINLLKNNYGNGSLVFMHHPLDWYDDFWITKISDKLKEALTNSDIISFFTGHTHMQAHRQFMGISQYTCPPLSFGISHYDDGKAAYTNRTGYYIFEAENKNICSRMINVTPEDTKSEIINYEDMKPKKDW